MIKLIIAATLFVILVGCQEQIPQQGCQIIAHAGGAINGHFYTNSKEALEAHYANGRRAFEIDFEKTRDDSWVLAHDWESWISTQGKIPSKKEFLKEPIQGHYSALALEDLVNWLKAHSEATLITDTKNNFSELVLTLQAIPEIQKQIIYQAYSVEDLDFLESHSVSGENIIFTNYKAKLTRKELQNLVKNRKIAGLTLPYREALKISGNLHKVFPETPVYVHGSAEAINSPDLQERLKNKGVAGFYLD